MPPVQGRQSDSFPETALRFWVFDWVETDLGNLPPLVKIAEDSGR